MSRGGKCSYRETAPGPARPVSTSIPSAPAPLASSSGHAPAPLQSPPVPTCSTPPVPGLLRRSPVPAPALLRSPGEREGHRTAPPARRAVPHLHSAAGPVPSPTRANGAVRPGPALPPRAAEAGSQSGRLCWAGAVYPISARLPVGESPRGERAEGGTRRRQGRDRGEGATRGAEQSAKARREQMTAWPAGAPPTYIAPAGTRRSYLTMTPRRSRLGHPGVSR